MLHRHLNPQGFSLASIDDVIARGGRADWEELREAILRQPPLLEIVRQICAARIQDPYAQRYHFWLRYVEDQHVWKSRI